MKTIYLKNVIMKSTVVECPPFSGGVCITLGMEPKLNVKVPFSYVEVSF